MPTKYEPSFTIIQNNIGTSYRLALVNSNVTLDRAIIKQEVVNGSGATLDDAGRNGDNHSFRAAFLGSSYFGTSSPTQTVPTLEEGEALFKLFMDDVGEIIFIHPSLGSIPGRVKSIQRNEKDELDALFLDFTFYQEGLRAEAVFQVDVIVNVENGFQETIEQEKANVLADLSESFGAEGYDFGVLELDEDLSILEQVKGFSTNIRNYAANLDAELNTMTGILEEVKAPANSLISVIDFGTDVPGRMLGQLCKTAERYKLSYSNLIESPSKFTSSLYNGLEELTEAFSGSESEKYMKSINAQTLAYGTADSYELDQEKRVALKQSEDSESFDVDGNRIKGKLVTGNVETLLQVERSLSIARNAIQFAIDGNRTGKEEGNITGLKVTSEALLFHVLKAKSEIEKIKTINVKKAMPLHLLLSEDNQPYNRAERTMSLNDIKNPTFCEGDILVYA